MKFTPHGPKILVKRIEEAEQMTKSGIYVAPDAKKQTAVGEVVAVNAGMLMADGTTLPSPFVVGQKVLFTSFAGMHASFDNVPYIILNEIDVWGSLSDQ